MLLAFIVKNREWLLLSPQDNPPWLSSNTVALLSGCTIFENCKSCRNGSWGGTLDDFYIKGIYCAECRAGWYGGDCMSKCPTRAKRHVRDRERWDGARAMLCLCSCSCTMTLAKGTGRRGQTQPGTEQMYGGEKFSSKAHLLGIGAGPRSWEFTTLLNFCFVLFCFKTLTTVTLEIFCSLHFSDICQHN